MGGHSPLLTKEGLGVVGRKVSYYTKSRPPSLFLLSTIY